MNSKKTNAKQKMTWFGELKSHFFDSTNLGRLAYIAVLFVAMASLYLIVKEK